MRYSSLAYFLPFAAVAFSAPAPEAAPNPESLATVHNGLEKKDLGGVDARSVKGAVARSQSTTHLQRRGLGAGALVTPSSNGNTVTSLQWHLVAHGQSIDVDGQFGPATKGAVSAFQSAAGLDADGIPGPATLGALVVNIQRGSNGNSAKAAQAALNAFGHGLDVDGIFGDGSHAAAVAFQQSKGLDADGIIGPNTWTALYGGGSSTGGGGGGGNCDAVTGPASPGETTWVGGIQINACLAGNLQNMINDAAAAGVTLGGWGYRSHDEQISLRQQNCPDVWSAPADACNPPTAIPGYSRHEYGLAVDFDNCGSGSAAFNWLSNNAGNYHFHNLPSESWHWSYDGN